MNAMLRCRRASTVLAPPLARVHEDGRWSALPHLRVGARQVARESKAGVGACSGRRHDRHILSPSGTERQFVARADLGRWAEDAHRGGAALVPALGRRRRSKDARKGATMSDGGGDRLAGRVALITGGSRGIGAGIATAFATEGAKIAFTYHHREDRAREVVAEIEKLGGQALAIKADAGSESDTKRAVEETVDRLGPDQHPRQQCGCHRRRGPRGGDDGGAVGLPHQHRPAWRPPSPRTSRCRTCPPNRLARSSTSGP